MKFTRREFLKISGIIGGLALASNKLINLKSADAYAQPQRVKHGKEITSICGYCGGGCGLIVTVNEGKVVNTEGDPDHPINEGALCSKANAIYQIANNDLRLKKVQYRAPGSDKWEEKTWEWAINKIADNVKKTRDATWVTKDNDGNVVNRTEGIAHIGGAALNTEECYLITKLMRALGLIYIEHEARLCHSSTVAGLAASFGRGAMTNHWTDIKNTDCMLIIGSNAFENHVISSHQAMKAKKNNGAKIISLDPRFTRTSSKADIYAPFRPGTDIALIGGMIKYVLDNNLIQKDYVVEYTNASFLIDPSFSFNDGLFSGYDPLKRSYDKKSFAYQLDENGVPKRDKTLNDPNCVFQLLKKHFSRYDIDTVCKVTGMPKDKFLQVIETFAETGKPDKSGTIMYAMGTTQHTVGTQYVRSYAILQLLLGNIGVPGGGINAMRGESNVQGSTDMCVLFHILPGYLKMVTSDCQNLKAYLDQNTPQTKDPDSVNYWKNTPKFFISLLKAWWGDKATKENDFCFHYLPKNSGNYSWISLFEAMYEGKIKGLFDFGMNPAVSGSNSNKELKALDKLEWLVEVQLWDTETSSFWRRPGVNPADIQTEVFLLPAAAFHEKEGSVTNSGRWAQWRYKAIEPVGESKSDLEILDLLCNAIKSKYAGSTEEKDKPILDLVWNYGSPPKSENVWKEINGYDLNTGKLLVNFTKLMDDGTTSCGNWLYSGCYTEEGNMMARREKDDPGNIGLYPKWAWCWPLNRRVLYNRCSVDASGNPYKPNQVLVKWDAKENKWITNDVPDFVWKDANGNMVLPEKSAKSPFIMRVEGVGALFSKDPTDGPFPEHYEPFESPVINVFSSQQFNPVCKIWNGDFNKRAEVGSSEFPIVGTTFRLTEHWQSGQMTRNLPWLAELMPEMFVEISKELAAAKGIKNGETVKVVTARGEVEAKACITERIKALNINGKIVEMCAMPWHFGYKGYVTGGPDPNKNYAANLLTAHIGDANTMIPEYKVFLCDIRKVV